MGGTELRFHAYKKQTSKQTNKQTPFQETKGNQAAAAKLIQKQHGHGSHTWPAPHFNNSFLLLLHALPLARGWSTKGVLQVREVTCRTAHTHSHME